jgi:tRNA (mo5U34)-methyltransferase
MPDFAVDEQSAREAIGALATWYHRIEVAPGVVTPGINDSEQTLATLGLPDDLQGASVLDIGTRDGFFAFECERRGADVLAVDYMPADRTGFAIASKLLNSRVRYQQQNIYNLSAADLCTFDVVLMLGLLYHLPDLIGALSIVRALCRDRLFLETHVSDEEFPELADRPVAVFCHGASLNADPTNYWAPTTRCVEAMLDECGFDVVTTSRAGSRSIFGAVVKTDDRGAAYYRAIALGDILPGKRRSS